VWLAPCGTMSSAARIFTVLFQNYRKTCSELSKKLLLFRFHPLRYALLA